MSDEYPKPSVRLFQIREDDLETLERVLPELMQSNMVSHNDPKVRVRWRKVREIVADVRWNYGPFSDVTEIPLDDPGDNDEGS